MRYNALCTTGLVGLFSSLAMAARPLHLAADEYQYMAICVDGDGALTSWLATFDAANGVGKAHEVSTKGHRWTVVSRPAPALLRDTISQNLAVRAVMTSSPLAVNSSVLGGTRIAATKMLPATALQNQKAADHVGDCQGNACNDVSVDWTGRGYHIANHGGRRVLVRIRFAFGFQCMDPSDIHLGPGESKDYGNGAFCNPYTANYE